MGGNRGRLLGGMAVGVALAMGGCASSAGLGGAGDARDTEYVSVITDAGFPIEIRRGADVRLNQQVEVSVVDAFNILPDVYRGMGFEPGVHDPSRRQVGVANQRISRQVLNRSAADFFDCGLDPGLNRPLAEQVPITATIVTTVVEGVTGTELATRVEGTARRSGGNAGTAQCRSTGMFEVLVAEMVKRAGAGGG